MTHPRRHSVPWAGLLLLCCGAALTLGPALLDWNERRVDAVGPCTAVVSPVAPQQPERAAALADGIWANPDQGSCVLSRHAMSEADLEALMESIAADPALRSRYLQARRLGPTL